MLLEPQIQTLSRNSRKYFFWLLVVIFLVALPSLIFYTTGYRLSFENEETSIVTTGGMYITTDNLEVDVYLDEEQVERPRLFRSAYYIQNIEAKLHRVVVQRDDLQTWVKVLPIDSYIVAEVAAFNMPTIPHVRPIAKYNTSAGEQVYILASTTINLFPKATTTTPYVILTKKATTTYQTNEEYIFVSSLFSTSTAVKESVFERFMDEVGRFGFATTSTNVGGVATDTESIVTSGSMQLLDRKGELYAVWKGSDNSIPYYFCTTDVSSSTLAERYGEHVALETERLRLSTTTPMIVNGNKICRPEIKIDRKRQDVYFYDFLPTSSDLVLLQLEDGLYVTEIDDRSWQNTQLIYPGSDFEVVLENEQIFIHEDGLYFELVTEIEPT
ncbi:hypothetical protein H6784_02245 [Candidatus Nomurabacteria bacterium]|nr:hypothetical protein [Candidatus Kaiserbacteria bacterium]MCB9814217.1 hypothetical protein [Candidatus Nomurabacteria bacterium]